jgi:BON domain
MRAILTALISLLLFVPAAVSAETTPAPARTAYDGVRDLEIQVRARRALFEDAELAPLNLGVTVQNGVAVVWGPVSSPEMSAKALRTVENVRGVFKVRSEMYVSTTAGLLPQPGLQALPDAPEQTSSALPDRRTGTLPFFPGRLTTKRIDELSGLPKPVTLLTPVVAPEDEAASGDVAGALERIRARDERYRSVRFELKNGAIYLRGGKPENVMAFAQAISKVPGVERVVLQNDSKSR